MMEWFALNIGVPLGGRSCFAVLKMRFSLMLKNNCKNTSVPLYPGKDSTKVDRIKPRMNSVDVHLEL